MGLRSLLSGTPIKCSQPAATMAEIPTFGVMPTLNPPNEATSSCVRCCESQTRGFKALLVTAPRQSPPPGTLGCLSSERNYAKTAWINSPADLEEELTRHG